MNIGLVLAVLGLTAASGIESRQLLTIGAVLSRSCHPDSACDDVARETTFTVDADVVNVTLTVTWSDSLSVFQLYSFFKSAESRIFDVILVDERLTSLITIPSLQSGSRNILIPEIFWLRKEQPPNETDMACCADFWYFEEGGSEAPTDDVSDCLGWLYPAAGVTAVVRHLRWEESFLVYDFLNEQEAKMITFDLEGYQFTMHNIENTSIDNPLQRDSAQNSTASLTVQSKGERVVESETMDPGNEKEQKIRSLLWSIYTSASVDKSVRVILLCSQENIKLFMSLANNFDREHDRSFALHFRSRWLIALPRNRTNGEELSYFLEGLDSLDNVAIVESRQVLSKQDMNVSANLQELIRDGIDQVRNAKDAISVDSLAKAISEVLNSTSDRCTKSRVETLYYGGSKGRYLNTVAMVTASQAVELRGRDDIFPNELFALNKRNLTVSTVRWTPFVIKATSGYEGFCMDLLKHLELVLNFTALIVEPEDGEFGQPLDNGTFSGLVGQLQRKEVDMVMASLTMNLEREAVMDFAFPFFTDHTNVLLRMPDPNESKWRTLIQPFKWQVHMTIWISLFSAAALITLLERLNPYYRAKREQSAFHNFMESIWYMYGSLLTQGGEHLPKSTTGLTMVSFWLMFAVIVASTYSGNLIAFLTVTLDTPPFDTLSGMLAQDRYKWGIVRGKSFLSFFEFNLQERMLKDSPDPIKRAVWDKIMIFNKTDPSVLSLSPQDHLQKVKAGDYAYIGDKSLTETWASQECNLKTISEKFFPTQYGIGLLTNSAYTSKVSYEMMKTADLGLLHMWNARWWPKKNNCQGSLVTEATPISLLDVQSAFYLIVIGIALSALVLGAENLRQYAHARKSSRRYTFSRSAFSDGRYDSQVELTRHDNTEVSAERFRVTPEGSREEELSVVETVLGSSTETETVLGSGTEADFSGPVFTLDMMSRTDADFETDSTNQIADSLFEESMDSGFDDLQQRKRPYAFKDKVPFYLARISFPNFSRRERSTSL